MVNPPVCLLLACGLDPTEMQLQIRSSHEISRESASRSTCLDSPPSNQRLDVRET